ncbi:hypothetical protein FA13DRAFT_1719485 [Coprinellus micaceus]|uniref:Uncharacterized protein n=1 Tax=Coprinellus micaceus TaxID=71717 RepID=A0A4Y7SBH8_COPMI|nr:hypothetical protein FA13DRAFT_1719485 [Coprinellus micaceus]
MSLDDASRDLIIESITASLKKTVLDTLDERLAALKVPGEPPATPAPTAAPKSGSATPVPRPPLNSTRLPFFRQPLRQAGTSDLPSLDHPFPHVEEATIAAIISHTFNPYHLFKLDPCHHEKSSKKTLQLIGSSLEIASDETALKDFKDLTSLMVPLMVYFESSSIMHLHRRPESFPSYSSGTRLTSTR